jgi:phage repressor protein C with HTH and peptisase S24 domain/DNA-binding XRE family transcriptional regulator
MTALFLIILKLWLATAMTLSGGHSRHWLTAGPEIPSRRPSAAKPPTLSTAILSAASLMTGIISMTYDSAQGGQKEDFACPSVRGPYAWLMSDDLSTAITRIRQSSGLGKAAFGRSLGVSGSAVSQWESGETTPSPRKLTEMANLYHVRLDMPPFKEFLLSKLGPHADAMAASMVAEHHDAGMASRVDPEIEEAFARELRRGSLRAAPEAPQFQTLSGLARDIPIYGIAVGGDDADFHTNGTEIDRAVRPPGLANARDIFALYVVNDSMYPAWREGALFYVNPHRTPAIGDDVVIEVTSGPESEPKPAFLKRLKARRGGKIVVEQFNPPKDIEFDRDEVKLYRVVPWEEALGLS